MLVFGREGGILSLSNALDRVERDEGATGFLGETSLGMEP